MDKGRGVANGWTGWRMSRGPESSGAPNQNEPIGMGAPHCSVYVGPRGSCYACGQGLQMLIHQILLNIKASCFSSSKQEFSHIHNFFNSWLYYELDQVISRGVFPVISLLLQVKRFIILTHG